MKLEIPTVRRRTAASGLLLWSCAFTQPAFAEEAHNTLPSESASPEESPTRQGSSWSIAAFGGYGVALDVGDVASGEAGGLGLGGGARARYNADFGLLLGGRLSHHFGEGQSRVALSSALFEIGWALPLGPLRAEPFASVGVTRFSSQARLCNGVGDCVLVDNTDYGTTLGAGVSLVYPFANGFFAGAMVESLLAVRPLAGVFGYATVGVTL